MENQQNNPLKKYFRQPKIYIKLPSSGNFYPPGTLEKTETGDFPIYAMTAKDELIMKTPDALLNGQATVDVIQSCVPNIKNAWMVPSIDLDAILVAIRMATYGYMLDLTIKIPEINDTRTYELDLRGVLDRLLSAVYDTEIQINDQLSAVVRPLNYKEFTQSATKTLEEQRIFSIVNDDTIEEHRKLEIFAASFKKLTEINVGMVSKSVVKIITPDGATTDQEFIKEFIDNADSEFYKTVMDHLEKQKDKFAIPPSRVATTEADQAAGAPAIIEVPVVLDVASFFA